MMCCPPGWHNLALELHAGIYRIDPEYKLDQIKEKFGGLRYYVSLSEGLSDGDRAFINVMIDAAEKTSYETCEECGKFGDLRSDIGWARTLCEEHYIEVVAKQKEWKNV